MKRLLVPALMLATLTFGGCSSLYYQTMQRFGVEKRDILVDRVQEARDSQEKAAEEFASALEQFRSVVQFDGGNLEAMYNELNGRLQRAEGRAREVTARINAVEKVARDLFREWESELASYTSAELRRNSEQQLQRSAHVRIR